MSIIKTCLQKISKANILIQEIVTKDNLFLFENCNETLHGF